jgi:hypothetical protein
MMEDVKMVRIYSPTYNLGCVGFKFSDMIYFDFYENPSFGMYLRVGSQRYTITIKGGIRRWK